MGKLVASRPNLVAALSLANKLARGEILVALREPQRQLVTLLRNRSFDLKEAEELEVYAEKVSAPEWGSW